MPRAARPRRAEQVVLIFDNFIELDAYRSDCVNDWLRFAQLNPNQPIMTRFIALWMSFNGWLACVSGKERDADMISVACDNLALQEEFARLMSESERFRQNVNKFSDYWPIFKASQLLQVFKSQGIDPYIDRPERIRIGVENGVVRAPRDWEAGRDIVWRDLISVIYRVRCNLFHGSKRLDNDADQSIVHLSFLTLSDFIAGANCYNWRGINGERIDY